jgi:hypothetical protein
MIRVVLAAVALAALPLGAPAGESVVHLKVRPMAAPKPALKYLLLPELGELNPGNPTQWYLRCFAEQRNFFFMKEANAERARYLAMPLADLAKKQLHGYGGSALTQADWGARLDTPDWQVLERVQGDGMDLRLPELEPLRILGVALQVRFRAEVAERRFDDAVRSIKTMFALARHLGEHPTESANLLGLLIAGQTLDTLEEMLQQPGCPNLYWALTDLPSPLVDFRKGMQGERALAAADLRPLRLGPMSESELEAVMSRLLGRIGFAREQAGQPPRNLRAEVAARARDPEKLRAARRRLVEVGASEILLWTLPHSHIILLDEKREYEVRRDEGLKLFALPLWQMDDLVDHGVEPGHDGQGLFTDLLPHVVRNRREQGRLEQRIALLRHVEALRLYAAANTGKLPPRLFYLRLPLPSDPFTGQPFDYKVEVGTAILRGHPPRGEEQNPRFNARYEVTIQK